METFTNKRKAEQACRVEKRAQKARNDLRRSERAGGYSNNKYIVTNSDKFEKRKFWEHVNRSTIIFE